jgi:succinate dehydrogenase flavin-adding protein (antitoxin of CptAB toxin-antitoxin module)
VSVQEIKAAIDQLTPEERCELTALLGASDDDAWDLQMTKDSQPGGKLHRLNEAAREEYERGESHAFPKPVE